MSKYLLIILVVFTSLFAFEPKDLTPTFMLNDTTSITLAGVPYVASSPETGLLFGLASSVNFRKYNKGEMVNKNMIEQFIFSPVFSYTLKDQYNIYLTTNYLDVDKYMIYNRIKISHYPDKFYGFGIDTDKDNEEEFTEDYIETDTYGVIRTIDHLWLGGYFYFRTSEVSALEENGLIDINRYKGVEECYVSGIGPYLIYNNTNHHNFPTKGFKLETKYLYFPEFMSEYEFSKYNFQISTYRDIFGDGSAFAGRISTDFIFSKDVPYFELYPLGGDKAVMGIKESRYRDFNRIFTTLEYRKEIFMRVGITLFASTGTMSSDRDKLAIKDFKHSFGGGVRYNVFPDESLYLRADIGFGSNGESGVYFMMGETF